MIAHQVYGDVHQPGLDAAFPAVAAPVRFHEAILRHAFGAVPVAQRRERKPINARPLQLHDRVEIFDSASGPFHDVEIGAGYRFHLCV